MTEPTIHFDKVNKWYGNNFHVLRDIDLEVRPGERLVICGPSGSGKSTMGGSRFSKQRRRQGQL